MIYQKLISIQGLRSFQKDPGSGFHWQGVFLPPLTSKFLPAKWTTNRRAGTKGPVISSLFEPAASLPGKDRLQGKNSNKGLYFTRDEGGKGRWKL
jgi:hypothetical protein